jgi:RNA polymerase sigma-70 factor, ECF subfamily
VPDRRAFEEVVEEHFDDVYGYVAFRLAPNREAAKDLTQDVFMAALERWGSYRGEASALSWLRAIARRKVADYFHAAKRAGELDISAFARSEGCETQQDRATQLAVVMRELPPECAQLLEEKYLEGRCVREIALATNRTEKAVECALSRARDLLRQRFLKFEKQELRHDAS